MTKPDADPFDLLRAASGPDPLSHSTIKRALEAVRSHLGMQVAYVSEFSGNNLTLKEVDAPGLENRVKVGDTMSLDNTYCRHILEGRLPEVMPDTAEIPFAASLPMARAMGIRSHISVPIALPDGRTYGMFCCMSTQPEPSLNARDVKMMKAFADLTALQISSEIDAVREHQKNTSRIRQILDADELSIVYQPIVRLCDNRIVGFECLSRFTGQEKYTPDVWFGLADSVGMGVGLEIAAISKALAALSFLPEDIYIGLNASPQVLLSDALNKSLEDAPANRIVLEVTEHAAIDDYSKLVTALRPLRSRGARLAIDDAGAGYSSLRHILALQPDIIKLDISLTRNVNEDPARSALAAALVHFAGATKCQILAEGVETAEELEALRGLGVDCVQGYYLGRPVPLDTANALAFRQCGQDAKVA